MGEKGLYIRGFECSIVFVKYIFAMFDLRSEKMTVVSHFAVERGQRQTMQCVSIVTPVYHVATTRHGCLWVNTGALRLFQGLNVNSINIG